MPDCEPAAPGKSRAPKKRYAASMRSTWLANGAWSDCRSCKQASQQASAVSDQERRNDVPTTQAARQTAPNEHAAKSSRER